MHRFLVIAAAVATLLVSAAPAAAAADTFRYAVHGSGAWASGVLYDGNRFEGFWVEIGDAAYRDSDGESFTSYLMFDHLVETCDAGRCVQVDTAAMIENVRFTIDRKKFTHASANAVVPAQRCRDDGTSMRCWDVSVAVAVSWTGYGSLIRSHGTASGGIAGQYQYTLNGAATERWGTVTGTIGSLDLETTSPAGAMYRTRQAERTVMHL